MKHADEVETDLKPIPRQRRRLSVALFIPDDRKDRQTHTHMHSARASNGLTWHM
jgi:hypothetical protein